jgi:ribosomal RNA-processing protein 36
LVLQGKKPFFMKAKDQHKQELIKKFEKLKQTGQLDKYLTKKRKRTAQKEHKHIPWHRRERRPTPVDEKKKRR